MKTWYKLINFSLFLFFFFIISPTSISAVDCSSVPISGNYSIGVTQGACSFANTVDGVDTGTSSTNTAVLTLATSGSLSILFDQTIAVGSISLTGGSIIIIDGGTIKPSTPLWVVDADVDGYPATTTQYAQTGAPTNGRRRNLMTSVTEVDCDDDFYSATNECCIMITWYQDSDGDTYGNPSISTEACDDDPPAGYVTDNTDCYDSNANAKPGQTTCYTTDRGDGSYDYDCNTTITKCTTCRTSCTNGSSFWTKGCCGVDPNKYCCNASWKAEKVCSGDAACGASGYTCCDPKKATCVQYPCKLSNPKKIGCCACTPTCR